LEIESQKPSAKGPDQMFTGDVWIDPIARGQAPSRMAVSAVHFPPGARTAWHAHSHGQTLYVTEGQGRIQPRGEPIVTIRPGDIIHAPADEWHWHGAAPDHFMTHITVTEGDAEWGEHVTDDEYGGGSAS
jgi:quercetin dioxygenase-like cupin family protein